MAAMQAQLVQTMQAHNSSMIIEFMVCSGKFSNIKIVEFLMCENSSLLLNYNYLTHKIVQNILRCLPK